MRDPPATSFSHLGRLPPIELHSSLILPSEASIFVFCSFCPWQSSSLDFSDLPWLFPTTQHHLQASLTFSSVFSPDTLVFLLIQLLLLVFHFYGCQRELIHTSRVILTPNKYKEYIHLTQAAKSASISSVAQTGKASTCLSHSYGPYILDSRASNHLSSNKDIFSSLTITSHIPMITLANGS